MKKYLITSTIFLANHEVLSWIALAAIVIMAIADFTLAVAKAQREREREDSLPVEFGEVWNGK